ncbi:MAG: V-type ATP synthase subunit D [Candidatus Omnitrophica bacterium]|nr:V-type ATP synthase subunit D [Candidatus Omnitrophota bacterium]MCM8789092.1 V-type ATP synthase subunit D [Candidatus Omnitrophota bacterium]
MIAKIPATKTNLLKTKRTLSLCKEGHQLLDEKRKILLVEISAITVVIEKIKKDVDELMKKAYNAVEKSLVSMGKTNLERISAAITTEFNLNISEKKIMGALTPIVSLDIKENSPYFSPLGVSHFVDETMILMREALKQIALLTEKKITLLRLEKEFQKTTKKVNALEKIHIPYYSEVARIIADRLDEESREAFVTLKEIKKKIATKEK